MQNLLKRPLKSVLIFSLITACILPAKENSSFKKSNHHSQSKFATIDPSDTDGDGLEDAKEKAIGTATTNIDTDGDGLEDHWEYYFGTDPLSIDSHKDPDGDGFPNRYAFYYGTNPSSEHSYPEDSPENTFLYVDDHSKAGDGSKDSPYASIQEAIDNAPHDYTVIIVEDGTYSQGFNLLGKMLLLRSRNGASKTIIHHSGIAVKNCPQGTTIDGFTIKEIEQNPHAAFKFNVAFRIHYSNVEIVNCIFENISQFANRETVGVFIENGDARFRNCIFRNNTVRGSLYTSSAPLDFTNCTFTANQCTDYLISNHNSLGQSKIINTIFWGNTGNIALNPLEPHTPMPDTHYSCIQKEYQKALYADRGTGNMYVDPLVHSDGKLKNASPCIQAGQILPENPLDLDRNFRKANDIGAYWYKNDGVSAIFTGGPTYNKRNISIKEIKSSGFNTVIVWTIHILQDGSLNFNAEFPLVKDGIYIGNQFYPEFPSDIQNLKQQPTTINRVEFGLSAWGSGTHTFIRKFYQKEGFSPGTTLYENFAALRNAIPSIDAFNNDDEKEYHPPSSIAFSIMLAELGYKNTICPYTASSHWKELVEKVNDLCPKNIDRTYLQCYAGGSGNHPASWTHLGIPVYPGLWGSVNASRSNKYHTPSEFKAKLVNWRRHYPLQGAFLWMYDEVQQTDLVQAYADAINTSIGEQ